MNRVNANFMIGVHIAVQRSNRLRLLLREVMADKGHNNIYIIC